MNPNRAGGPRSDPWDDAPPGRNGGLAWDGPADHGNDPYGSDEFAPGEFAAQEDDVPFRGARRIDVSTAKAAPPRRPSVTGGPGAGGSVGDGPGSSSRGRPRRPESGAFRRIRDTGAMRTIMDTNAMRTLMDTAAMQILRERFAGRGRLIASVVGVAWVAAAVAAVVVITSPSGSGTPKASASSVATVSANAGGTGLAGTGQASPRPSATPSRATGNAKKRTTSKITTPVAVLSVANVAAFGPDGTSDGDNPAMAAFVIADNGTRPWQTKWYGTAHFGALQPGTGLLLDMGKTVTVTKVTLEFAAGSADVIIRVGNSAVPGTFTEITDGNGVGGTVSLSAATPTSGRYLEVWFTSLPQDAAGTYQESVYGVQVTGGRRLCPGTSSRAPGTRGEIRKSRWRCVAGRDALACPNSQGKHHWAESARMALRLVCRAWSPIMAGPK